MAILTKYYPYKGSVTNSRTGKTGPWGSSYKVVVYNQRNWLYRAAPKPRDRKWLPTSGSVASASCYDSVGTITSGDNTYLTSVNDWMGTGFFTPPYTVQTEDINSFLVTIKEQGINLGMMLAEYEQTAQMFAGSASRLVKLYRQARKGNLRGFFKTAKKAADPLDNWMMYRYGIRPFIQDANAIHEILLNAQRKVPLVKKIKGRRIRDNRTFTSKVGSEVRSQRWFASSQRVAWVKFTASFSRNMQDLGLTNPPALLWEVIPFSFVVDWFIGIGDYLSSLDALIGVEKIACYTNLVWHGEVTHTPVSCPVRYRSYSRTTFSASPKIPRWDPSLTWKRLVDSTAMLRNLRRQK